MSTCLLCYTYRLPPKSEHYYSDSGSGAIHLSTVNSVSFASFVPVSSVSFDPDVPFEGY
jgi:hypothetical protein